MAQTDLRARLAQYVAEEPGFGLSADALVMAGRRSRRRQHALTAGLGVLSLGVAGAGAGLALDDRSAGESTTVDPAATGSPVPSAHRSIRPAVPTSAEIPAAIRALVSERAPAFSKEIAMEASTWAAHPLTSGPNGGGDDTGPPALPASEYDTATSWYAAFTTADGGERLFFELDHFPPDDPYRPSCDPYPAGDCHSWTLADGRQAQEYYAANTAEQPDGSGPYLSHGVAVQQDQYRVLVSDEITNGSSPDPHTDYRLSSEELQMLASDSSLVFPLPDPLPPLPSWRRCIYSADPPSTCP